MLGSSGGRSGGCGASCSSAASPRALLIRLALTLTLAVLGNSERDVDAARMTQRGRMLGAGAGAGARCSAFLNNRTMPTVVGPSELPSRVFWLHVPKAGTSFGCVRQHANA